MNLKTWDPVALGQSLYEIEIQAGAPQMTSWTVQTYREELSSLLCRVWWMEAIGFLLWRQLLDEVTVMQVVARERGRGWGRELMSSWLAFLNQEATERGERWRICLEVKQSNFAAQRLYSSQGFVLAGSRKDYYGKDEDALLWELWIPSFPQAVEP